MVISRRSHKRKNPWLHEFDDIIRGAAGGFLFGIPLLYTMEVWWIGSFSQPPRMLIAIATTFIVVFLLIQTEGFRKSTDSSLIDTAMDTIEALAIGFICTASILFLLREITSETPLVEGIGKIIFEGVPFSLGVGLARSFLSGTRAGENQDNNSNSHSPHQRILSATITDIGATLIGATLIAFNIAPTDEVPMLAAAASPPWLLAIMAASLLISYAIVFQSGFTDQKQRREEKGIFQRPLSETVMAYLVSLMAAAFMLWFFQQLTFDEPWQLWLRYTIILGLPASVGGAAGRLVA